MDLLVSLVAGAVAVPLLQVLKGWFGLKGKPMAFFSVIVSFVLAILVCLLARRTTVAAMFDDPFVAFGSTGIIWTTATMIYKVVGEKMKLGG